jgi:hypothetical protein
MTRKKSKDRQEVKVTVDCPWLLENYTTYKLGDLVDSFEILRKKYGRDALYYRNYYYDSYDGYTEDNSEITYMRLETDEEMGKRMLPLDKSEINQEN